MAGIILKDQSGNAVEYDGISRLEAYYKNSEGAVSSQKFTRLAVLNAYAIKLVGSENNIAKYEILATVPHIGSDDAFMFGYSDAEYQALGGDGITVILTLKRLTVGNTYLATEMY